MWLNPAKGFMRVPGMNPRRLSITTADKQFPARAKFQFSLSPLALRSAPNP
jgi:hypothetical protein